MSILPHVHPRLALLAIAAALPAAVCPGAPPVASDDAALLQKGRDVAAAGFAVLSQNLMAAMTKGGVPEALKFCHANALPLTEGVSKTHDATVQRVSLKARNPGNRATGRDAVILNEFSRILESGQPATPRIERDAQGRAVFFAPILIAMDTCLKCHGEPGKDIADADLALIRSLYPEDAATGFKTGQLRGMWKITFNPPPPKP
jgi:hypothetical protein